MGIFRIFLILFVTLAPFQARSQSDESDLLKAVFEAPLDDAPRLVYADWLQENGEADRAEFIRLQCKMSEMNEWDPLYHFYKARAKSIFEVNPEKFGVNDPTLSLELKYFISHGFVNTSYKLDPVPFKFENYDRGFLGKAIIYAPISPEELGVLLSFRHSPITKLGIDIIGTTDLRFFSLAIFKRLSSLTLVESSNKDHAIYNPTPLSPALAADVASSRGLINLRELKFVVFSGSLNGHIGDEGLKAVASSEYLKNLQVLELRGQAITDTGAQYLAESTTLSNLRVLKMDNNPISDRGMRAIFSANIGKKLQAFSFAKNSGSALNPPEIVKIFNQLDASSQLRALKLKSVGFTPTDLEQLANSPALNELYHLIIQESENTEASFAKHLNKKGKLKNVFRFHDIFSDAKSGFFRSLLGRVDLDSLAIQNFEKLLHNQLNQSCDKSFIPHTIQKFTE